MTALVTALGLLPMAIGSGEPGREIEGPLAIVVRAAAGLDDADLDEVRLYALFRKSHGLAKRMKH